MDPPPPTSVQVFHQKLSKSYVAYSLTRHDPDQSQGYRKSKVEPEYFRMLRGHQYCYPISVGKRVMLTRHFKFSDLIGPLPLLGPLMGWTGLDLKADTRLRSLQFETSWTATIYEMPNVDKSSQYPMCHLGMLLWQQALKIQLRPGSWQSSEPGWAIKTALSLPKLTEPSETFQTQTVLRASRSFRIRS